MKFIKLGDTNFDNMCQYIQENFANNHQILSMYQQQNMVKMRIENNIEIGIVCEIDDRIVGIATAITSNKKNYWGIAVLYVSESQRNRGIGKKLIKELERHIYESSLSKYKENISVNETNKEGLALLESMEYMREGRIVGLIPDDNIIILGKINYE